MSLRKKNGQTGEGTMSEASPELNPTHRESKGDVKCTDQSEEALGEKGGHSIRRRDGSSRRETLKKSLQKIQR